MKKIALIFFIVLSISQSAFSQKDYREGYIVTNKGDTLFGKVKDRKVRTFNSVLYDKIRFKQPKSGWFPKKYRPAEILGYGYDDMHFRSLPFTSEGNLFRPTTTFAYGELYFVKIVIDGRLSLIESEYIDDETGYITSKLYLKKKDEMTYALVPMISFRKKMAEYFSDVDEIKEKIQSREYRLRDIREIVREYNEQI